MFKYPQSRFRGIIRGKAAGVGGNRKMPACLPRKGAVFRERRSAKRNQRIHLQSNAEELRKVISFLCSTFLRSSCVLQKPFVCLKESLVRTDQFIGVVG